MHKPIRNPVLLILIGGSLIILALLATVLLISSSYAGDPGKGNLLVSRLHNSSLQKNIIDSDEAFRTLEQPFQELTGFGNTKANSYHLDTGASKVFRIISFSNRAKDGLMSAGWRNRLVQPIAMIILGVGMIALATFRRKRTRRQLQAKPQSNAAISRMAIRIQ